MPRHIAQKTDSNFLKVCAFCHIANRLNICYRILVQRTKTKIFFRGFLLMTRFEKARCAEIARHTANIGHDDGANGRIFELECASANSRKTRVSKQGQADSEDKKDNEYRFLCGCFSEETAFLAVLPALRRLFCKDRIIQ